MRNPVEMTDVFEPVECGDYFGDYLGRDGCFEIIVGEGRELGIIERYGSPVGE